MTDIKYWLWLTLKHGISSSKITTLLECFSTPLEIYGAERAALSETPGLGSRVNDANYLSQYNGTGGKLALGSDIDAISGATISSRSVLAGVNRAFAAVDTMGLVTAD